MKWEEETGTVSVFRKPSNFANGNTRDRQGRLVSCEHGGRRITRTEYDGTITVLMRPVRRQAAQLAQRHRGEVGRLDLVHRPAVRHPVRLRGPCRRAGTAQQRVPVRSRDRESDRRGRRDRRAERAGLFARRVKRLYVVESRASPRKIFAYDVVEDGTRIANKRVLIEAGPGTPDGFRCDEDGNLWCGWGMGEPGTRRRHGVLHPDGEAHRPDRPAGAVLQPVLRRREAEPAVHGGQPVDLRALHQHARRGLLVNRRRSRSLPTPASSVNYRRTLQDVVHRMNIEEAIAQFATARFRPAQKRPCAGAWRIGTRRRRAFWNCWTATSTAPTVRTRPLEVVFFAHPPDGGRRRRAAPSRPSAGWHPTGMRSRMSWVTASTSP